MEINQQYLQECLSYNPETGDLTWKERPKNHFNSDSSHQSFNTRWSSKIAGCRATLGRSGYLREYITIGISGKKYYAHRLVWLYMSGDWPTYEIDHINGIGTDNRFVNLRDVTSLENSRNMKLQSNNASGHCGVTLIQKTNKWASYIKINKTKKHLGNFDSFEEAVIARKKAEKKYGFSINHGKR